MSVQPQSATATRIRNLARKYEVAYVGTQNDVLANHITRLAGDHVEFDEVEQLLIALQRAGHLSRAGLVRQASYLKHDEAGNACLAMPAAGRSACRRQRSRVPRRAKLDVVDSVCR
jgi:hypothetical protein